MHTHIQITPGFIAVRQNLAIGTLHLHITYYMKLHYIECNSIYAWKELLGSAPWTIKISHVAFTIDW